MRGYRANGVHFIAWINIATDYRQRPWSGPEDVLAKKETIPVRWTII